MSTPFTIGNISNIEGATIASVRFGQIPPAGAFKNTVKSGAFASLLSNIQPLKEGGYDISVVDPKRRKNLEVLINPQIEKGQFDTLRTLLQTIAGIFAGTWASMKEDSL